MFGYGAIATILTAALVSAQYQQADPLAMKMSLVKPYQTENWIPLGNPYFSPKEAVLTSKRRAGPQRAALWNPTPFPFRQQFNITLRTNISASPGPKTGQGLGLWLLEKPDGAAAVGELGAVYGSRDYFRGLGIVFDTIDDDKRRNNPSISAHYLDGSVAYPHADDGISTQLAGCLADYRRSDVWTQVVYNGTALSVHVNLSGKFQRCLEVPLKMRTDRDWFLGISAETIASEYPQETHEIVSMQVKGVADWNAATRLQEQKQQAPPTPVWQAPPVEEPAAEPTAETLHDKIDLLMKATSHTALESQQAGEALKEVQTNVLRKIQQATNMLVQQVRRVDQGLSQHVTGSNTQLQALAKTVESTKASVDSGRVDTERRAHTIDAQIATLQTTIKEMNGVLERLSKSFQMQISREIGKGTARMAAAAAQGGGAWNVWVFIILFQVVFVGFLLHRSFMNKKLDKLL